MKPNFIRRSLLRTLGRASEALFTSSAEYNRFLTAAMDKQSFVRLVRQYYRDSSTAKVKTVMDVGANVGQSAETFLRIFPAARVYSLEPARKSFDDLCSRHKGNSRLTLLHYAASDEEGPRELRHSEVSLANSLSIPWRSTGTSETVNCRRIDRLSEELNIDQLNLLKIDTEGHDLQVLKGTDRMLFEGRVDMIVVECGFKPNDSCHSDFYAIADYLKPFNFCVSGFTEANNFEWNDIFCLLYCNAVFTRSE
jgi:FkbM family methyltransferase